MSLEYDKRLIETAKALRRSLTPQERKLWYEVLTNTGAFSEAKGHRALHVLKQANVWRNKWTAQPAAFSLRQSVKTEKVTIILIYAEQKCSIF